jgi:hypothetical protein
VNQTQAQEKQVEVEILRKSVEKLENTIFALESLEPSAQYKSAHLVELCSS